MSLVRNFRGRVRCEPRARGRLLVQDAEERTAGDGVRGLAVGGGGHAEAGDAGGEDGEQGAVGGAVALVAEDDGGVGLVGCDAGAVLGLSEAERGAVVEGDVGLARVGVHAAGLGGVADVAVGGARLGGQADPRGGGVGVAGEFGGGAEGGGLVLRAVVRRPGGLRERGGSGGDDLFELPCHREVVDRRPGGADRDALTVVTALVHADSPLRGRRQQRRGGRIRCGRHGRYRRRRGRGRSVAGAARQAASRTRRSSSSVPHSRARTTANSSGMVAPEQ